MRRILPPSWPAVLLLLAAALVPGGPARAADGPRIHVAFLWHMHQPLYWPGETLLQTEAAARYAYSVVDIHLQRTGPYTSWPWEAVQKGITAGLGHLGAQVSFSGSLIRNLDDLEAGGLTAFAGWRTSWLAGSSATTVLGHPRLDLVAFGDHHPLMPLLDPADLRRQIQEHRLRAASMGGGLSRGIFPPENAFSPAMVPALVQEGLDWVLVDNIHFDRACAGYPYSTGGNLVEPNRAEQRNPDPGDWISLSGLWAPTPVSARFGHRPHWVEAVDPDTGETFRMVAVPTDRYMGNEDGRGGFGALDYEGVLSQLEAYNDDPAHPLLVVLHHDGDNYGGGSESYYHSNFQAFVDWLLAHPDRFEATTVQDYLDRFPPDPGDVIHVEPGSWSGADNGDPEFSKWLGDPAADGYSPDRNSWAVITAARHRILEAEAAAPGDPAVEAAWDLLRNGQASDYWYWDGAQDGIWDSHPARAATQALDRVAGLQPTAQDRVAPTLFPPQREPYNPGAAEWGVIQPSTVEIWTLVQEARGLARVTLRYRVDGDGVAGPANDLRADGPEVGAWVDLPMAEGDFPPARTDPPPPARARLFAAALEGFSDVLIDYFVEAEDAAGNEARTALAHVWIGDGAGGGGAGTVRIEPPAPAADEAVTITVAGAGQDAALHWGVDGFATPPAVYQPAGTVLYGGTGPAVETPLERVGEDLVLTLGPFDDPSHPVGRVDFVIHYADGRWDNNGGADYGFEVGGGATAGFLMDGVLDPGALAAADCGDPPLWYARQGSLLYLAAAPAGGEDLFVLLAGDPGAPVPAPWAKAGEVAAWDAFLAREGDNGWAGWFQAPAGATAAAGEVLEGVVDLAGLAGGLPEQVRVAVLRYASADGGALSAQCPAGNGDGDVPAAEWWTLDPVVSTQAPAAARGMRLRVFPNPFNPRATVTFHLGAEGRAQLDLFDARGRRLRRWVDESLPAGDHERVLDGRGLAGGVYFLRLITPAGASTARMVLLK